MMSLALAKAGAEVVHLDASPKSIAQGRENAALSGLEGAPIRWITDDAMKFVEREIRRGSKYDAIVLDPPKFGRGPKNETWRFETDFPKLLDHVRTLLSDQPALRHRHRLRRPPLLRRRRPVPRRRHAPRQGHQRRDGDPRILRPRHHPAHRPLRPLDAVDA